MVSYYYLTRHLKLCSVIESQQLALFLLPCISFLAFLLKAMTGFGPAIVVISIGSLLFPPQAIIAASSVLDFIAGVVLLRKEGTKKEPRFLGVLIGVLAVGTVVGAAVLSNFSTEQFRPLLGIGILCLSIWFLFFRNRIGRDNLQAELPARCDGSDLTVSFISGCCGGLFGIGGPPLVWHLGRRYQKEALRGVLIAVFTAAALVRVGSYAMYGMIDSQVLLYVALSIPGQVLGLYLGTKLFLRISENHFSLIVGAILFAVSLKLVW